MTAQTCRAIVLPGGRYGIAPTAGHQPLYSIDRRREDLPMAPLKVSRTFQAAMD